MTAPEARIKLSYVTGLRAVVLEELRANPLFSVMEEGDDSVFVEYAATLLAEIKKLKSVARAYLVVQSEKLHPAHLANHKSILGNLIAPILAADQKGFKTFRISCAGSNSPEVQSISKYIRETYGLAEADEADLKIHIIKPEDVWEVGIQITPRPLSFRDYKVVHMSGAMDPTVAYAVNYFANLERAKSYLNPCSGSGTLLIEAARQYPDLERLLGFDTDKKHLSLSIQNIQKAGLIRRVQVKEASLLDTPDFGTFDAIVSDLPFGMAISKDENLDELYKAFLECCERSLNPGGRVVAYTSEYEILERQVASSAFRIIKSVSLKFMTSAGAYLQPRILVLERR
ncbi:MAG TPA: methyltransferase domain-containing protein [Candidatus Paceibacterota bacterium]